VTKAQPGQGYVSCVPGRKKDLQLSEYVLVGPLLATFIASLANWDRMSRAKICEFLASWLGTPLSRGTVDRCVREAGIACVPVVEGLIRQLQEQDILHLDETPWWEQGQRLWLWVAMSTTIAVFIIGPRTKEMFRILVSEAFLGWLVTDGYLTYRDHQWRQRCLAHLIRKAVGLSGAVDPQARRMGEWLLRELRRLIQTVAAAGEEATRTSAPILARLKRACTA
jgi:IS1 family transposase